MEQLNYFESLNPPKAVDVLIRLDSKFYRRKLFGASLSNVIEVLVRLPDEMVFEIIGVKSIDDLAEILNKLHVDDVVEVLFKLPSKTGYKVLKILSTELSAEVSKVIEVSFRKRWRDY
ncbi:MAG: hypothetical protein QW154_03040 [Sulfolobales archaeon]